VAAMPSEHPLAEIGAERGKLPGRRFAGGTLGRKDEQRDFHVLLRQGLDLADGRQRLLAAPEDAPVELAALPAGPRVGAEAERLHELVEVPIVPPQRLFIGRGHDRRSVLDATLQMPRRKDLKSILLLGSGPIVIGQACEFDYSGVQALKALREEGYRTILLNSNPATIMTDPEWADRTYIEPLTVEAADRILAAERPDAVLPTLGGQTALN